MKTYTAEKLKEIIREHHKWLLDSSEGKRANLRYANLRSANLRYANLRSADLSYSNLSSADLRSADLSYANLRSADLSSANLRSADLRSADLSYALGNNKEIKTIQTGTWIINYTKDTMAIGCKQHSIEQWYKFTDDTINDMDGNALEFWEKWKPILRSIGVFEEVKE